MNTLVVTTGEFGHRVVGFLDEMAGEGDSSPSSGVPDMPNLPPVSIPPDTLPDGPDPVPVRLETGQATAADLPDGSSRDVFTHDTGSEHAPAVDLSGIASYDSGWACVSLAPARTATASAHSGTFADGSLGATVQEWLKAWMSADDTPLVVVVGDARSAEDEQSILTCCEIVESAFTHLPQDAEVARMLFCVLPSHEQVKSDRLPVEISTRLSEIPWLTRGPLSTAWWLTEWSAKNTHIDDAALAEQMALVAHALGRADLYASLVGEMSLGATRGVGTAHISAGASGVVLPESAPARIRRAVAALCDSFLSRNQEVPPAYTPPAIVRDRLNLTPSAITPQLMRMPDDFTGIPDMRKELKEDFAADWDLIPERAWPDFLRNLRHNLIELRLRNRLLPWLHENWEHWTTDTRGNLVRLTYALVETDLASLPDATFVIKKLDEHLSGLSLEVQPFDDQAGKKTFDTRVERLTRAIEHRPFTAALALRYALLGIAMYFPCLVGARIIAANYDIASAATVFASAAVSGLLALVAGAVHASRANVRIERLRGEAMDSLSGWLIADLEAYAASLLKETTNLLHQALEKVMLPRLNGFMSAHERIHETYEQMASTPEESSSILSIDAVLGMQEESVATPFVAFSEATRFLVEGGRGNWMTLTESELSARLLGFCRLRIAVESDESVEEYLLRRQPAVSQPGGMQTKQTTVVGTQLVDALSDMTPVMMQSSDYVRQNRHEFVVTSIRDSTFWSELGRRRSVCQWSEPKPLTVLVGVREMSAIESEAEGDSDA